MYNYDMTKGTMTLPCKRCGEFNTINTWYNVDSRKHPEQKQLLLNNELFKYECKKCGNIILAGYEMMYHDADNKVIIYLDQMSKYTKQIKKKIRQQKKEFGKNYKFRIVKSVNALHEKALIFEHKYDDKIIELIIIDLIATTSAIHENLDIERVSLSFRDDMIVFNLFCINTESNEDFMFPSEMDYETYLINERTTRDIIRLKEDLFIDMDWGIKYRKKMYKKLKGIIKR